MRKHVVVMGELNMLKRLIAVTLAGFSLLTPSIVFANGHTGANTKAASRAYTNGVCHEKIDPKKLPGPAAKIEWDKCKVSPDSYQ